MSCPAQFGGWSGESADSWLAEKLLPDLVFRREQPQPGPGECFSGPGFFFRVKTNVLIWFPSHPLRHSFISCLPREANSGLEPTRSNSHYE